MKYLVIYNYTSEGRGGGMSVHREGVYWQDTQTILKPFEDLQEAVKYASERKGYVVKLVEVAISEVETA